MNNFWDNLYKLNKEVKKPSYDKPNRSGKKLDKFAQSLGCKIERNAFGKKHGVYKQNNKGEWVSIHNNFGIMDSCANMYEVELCLEDYKTEL